MQGVKSKVKEVKPREIQVIEIKTSNPKYMRSYTKAQRVFFKLLPQLKPICKYIVVHVPVEILLQKHKSRNIYNKIIILQITYLAIGFLVEKLLYQ